MISITVKNSLCSIEGVTSLQLAGLRKACSYETTSGKRVMRRDKSGRVRWVMAKQVHYLMTEKGQFPTGLLYLVEEFLTEKRWHYKLLDARIRPPLSSISNESLYIKKSFKPYPEQLEAAEAALKYGRGIIVAPTGVGKSKICELICEALKVPTLIVVPTLELKRQLTETLRESFGDSVVGPLNKSTTPKYPISVENVDALEPGKLLEGIDCVIIDEFHHSAAISYRKLNMIAWSGIYFKFGLTATPFRSNTEERLALESVLSKVIYQITYDTAVDKGYIVPLEAYYVEIPKEESKKQPNGWKKKVGEKLTYHDSYSQDIVQNGYRNALIANIVSNLIKNNQSTLILIKQIEHGNLLGSELSKIGYEVPFAEGISNTKSWDIDRFNSGDVVALLGTTGVIGEGVDTKRAEWAILAGGGKSKNQFMQNVGRVFRKFTGKKSGKIILFKDCRNKWLVEHFNKCLKFLKEEYGVTAEKLDLNT